MADRLLLFGVVVVNVMVRMEWDRFMSGWSGGVNGFLYGCSECYKIVNECWVFELVCVWVGLCTCVCVWVCVCVCAWGFGVQMVMSLSVSVWRFSDGRLNFMWSISRISSDEVFFPVPMTLKASGSMGWLYFTAWSRMAECCWSPRTLLVRSLIPLCSAIRLPRLQVVWPTYVAEQRQRYSYTTNDCRSWGILSLYGKSEPMVYL